MYIMTWIMLLLVRILVLRINQHAGAATSRSDLVGSNVTGPHLAGQPQWRNTSVCARGPDGNGRCEDDAHHLAPVKLSRRATVDESFLPSRVKKPLIGAHQHQIYSDVDAIAGRLTRLPCFVRPLGPSDSISLVLWYRGEDISGTPIYSVDARYTPFNKAQHFVHKSYQDRQVMNFTLSRLDTDTVDSAKHEPVSTSSTSPKPNESKPISASTAHLYIMPVEESDAGLYWCRVDYKWERTTISIVTVNVIVPPRQLQMQFKPGSSYCRSESVCRLSLNQTITLDEDSSVTLVCFSEGGKPLPILNWYRNDELIRSEIFHSLTQNNRTLQSELHLTQVRPAEHNVLLKCLSSNDNQTFLSSQIRLKVNTKPSRVELVPVNVSRSSVVLAGTQLTVICRSFGSRPAANHSWSIVPGERHLPVVKRNVVLESEVEDQSGLLPSALSDSLSDFPLVTESMVQLTVHPEDNGHRLVCRARNDLLRQSALDGVLFLNVAFAPKVTLQQFLTGSSGKSHSFISSGYSVRGSDLHLLCNITANPTTDKVLWYRNSHKLSEDDLTRQPIKITENGTHLIVANVTDEWQGFYQCVAHNQHGSGFSNQFQVQILHKPQCITPTQTIPANFGSVVTMICDVDANPGNVTFFWHTKHTDLRQASLADGLQSGPAQHLHIKDKGLKSRLEIRIENGDDFGQYSCWAKNFAGVQEEPCYYNVYENTVKQQLLCETNISFKTIQVQCQRDSANTSELLYQTKVTNRSFDVSEQTKSILFNLRIFKDKQQLINLTSIEPHFLVAVGELQQKEFDSSHGQSQTSQEMNDSGDNSKTNSSHVDSDEFNREDQSIYLMLISALVNGRLTSDISLSFKVPDDPETNAIVEDKTDLDKDIDLEEGSKYPSQNVSISRYKKIYPSNESPEPKDTNAASFTTAASIKQLPLIWTVFLVTIIVLVVLILIVLTNLHSRKKRKKPHVRFCRQHQEMPDREFVGNGLSSKEYLMEDVESEPNTDKESIQLFTLANFDQTYSYSDHSPSGPDFVGLKHVDLRTTLPDLMTDTFHYDHVPMQSFEMETSQHNLYIIHKPSTAGQCVSTLGPMCHDLVSFGGAINLSHAVQSSPHEHSERFRTLPNLKGRHSMRIALENNKDTSFCKRTPSVDAIDMVGWIKADDQTVDHDEQCLTRRSTEQVFPQMGSYPLDINCNQVP